MLVSNALFIKLCMGKDKIKTCSQRAKNYILNITVQQIWIHYMKKKQTQRISSEGKYKHLHILISGISCSASLLIVICMFCWLNDPPHKFFIVLCKQHSNKANDVLFIFGWCSASALNVLDVICGTFFGGEISLFSHKHNNKSHIFIQTRLWLWIKKSWACGHVRVCVFFPQTHK